MEKEYLLAIMGGNPVRKKPFPEKAPGMSLIDNEELIQLKDVVINKRPFRFNGLGNSNKVDEVEKLINEFLKVKYTLAVSSGSAALSCAIVALGIGIGDEVILPAFSWYADYCCIVNAGAIPIFTEIDESLGIDFRDIERKITKSTKAIIVVHYQGTQANMKEIMRIATKYDLRVIEDFSQAFGGKYNDKLLGTIGDIGVSSFQSNKIVTCGEGGILCTNDEEFYVRAIRYHDLGYVRPNFNKYITNVDLIDTKYSFSGSQFRMSELHGSFLLAQINKLDMILKNCRNSHKKLRDSINTYGVFELKKHIEGDCGITIFLMFKTKKLKNFFEKCLSAEGISVGGTSAMINIYETPPIVNKGQFNKNNPPFGEGYIPNKNYKFDEIFNKTNEIIDCFLPIGIGPLYDNNDIDDIATAICKVACWINGHEDEIIRV